MTISNFFLSPLIFLVIVHSTLESSAQCYQEKSATYQAGEEIWYDVKYNWGLLWVDAAEVRFSVRDTVYQNEEQLWFSGYGRSLPKWDWVYKVRDSFDAIGTEKNLKPLFFYRNTSEGSYKVDEKYWFDHSRRTIRSSIITSKQEHYEMKTVAFNEKCVWDVLSAIYYARNLQFNRFKEGDKIPFNLIVDGKIYELSVTYLGKETLNMPDDSEHKTIKFSAELVAGTIFDEEEEMTVWVSDDRNKIPLKVQAKIKVGWVKAFLRSADGLRFSPYKY